MDVQIGHEKTLTGLMPVLAGVDLVYGLGMIDMGMAISYEQFLMDAEFVRMFKRTEKKAMVDEDALALEVIEAVGPAGNYLSQRHTLKHMRDEISTTTLIDRQMREKWEKDGAKDMPARARALAKDILANHQPIPLPEDVQDKLRAMIEREGELLCR
ncbi:Trimethylamine:corrinoid methyltransferase [uncultured Eubacterium sp.]|nr:Trimethylamine:corrinoid methyltransferase [uncultured Eubacterium sp.]